MVPGLPQRALNIAEVGFQGELTLNNPGEATAWIQYPCLRL